MSAFNSNCKVLRGADGKIHLIYNDETDIYYSYSTDGGNTFIPWQFVDHGDTIPVLALASDGMPWLINAKHFFPNYNTCALEYYLYKKTDGGWSISYDEVYRKDFATTYPNVPALLHPASFVIAGDSGYIVFQEVGPDNIIVSSFPLGLNTSYTTTQLGAGSNYPSIGYDPGGRLVVLVQESAWGPMRLYFRDIGGTWSSIPIQDQSNQDFLAYGSPSLWVGYNEVRIIFGGCDYAGQSEGLIYLQYRWLDNTYQRQTIEIVSPSFDYSDDGIEGYSSFASRDVVLWRNLDDIYYAQRAGVEWTEPQNISNTPDEISSYAQGIVSGGGLHRKLFVLWTEKLGDDYYLVRKLINLPPAYPYIDVARSDILEATGHNNSQRLLRDGDSKLHLAFTSEGKVYHSFFQDTSWTEPVLIGEGKYPALSLGADGKIYCIYNFHGYKKFYGKMYYVEYLMESVYDGTTWSEPAILFHTYGTFLWGVGAPSMAIQDTMVYVVFKSYHGPHPNPAPGTVPPHIIVVEGPALIYGKFPVNAPLAFTYEIIDTIIKEQIETDTLTYRDSLVPLLISPSITVDLAGVRHILWEGDSTQMRYYTITDTIIRELFDAEVDYPWLTMNGDRIDLFWTARDAIRYRYGWTGTPNLSSTQTVATCESPFSSGQYLTWTRQEGGISYLYYGAIPASGSIEPIEVDYSTNLIAYPQILYNPEKSNELASIDLVWTDYSYLDSLGYIYYLNIPIEEPAPPYAFDMGQEIPVPILVQRAGYLTLGPEDYQTFDYDSTELIYHLSLHSPHKKYKIRWTYYHEEPSKLKLQFNIDDILHHNCWVEPGEKVVEDKWIPQACLEDNEITVKVKRLKGSIAVLSGIEIEMEQVGGGGGPQAYGNQVLRQFLFEQMYPNPTKGVLKIRFNSPDERKVSVKIYDVVGRLAETVFDGNAKIGMNEFLIVPRDLSAGVYFVRVETSVYKKTQKIILLR